MRDLPAIFSKPMIDALIAGRKTQTRRRAYIDGKPSIWLRLWWEFNYRPIAGFSEYVAGRDGVIYRVLAPFQVRALTPGQGKYPLVSLSSGGEVVTRNVHRLICEAWYGPPPTERHETRHLDSDRANSAASNLDWALPEENWTDRRALGRGMGEDHHSAVLSRERVAEIRKSDKSRRALAEEYGVAQSTIFSAQSGETWGEPSAPAAVFMPRIAAPKIWVKESHWLYGKWRKLQRDGKMRWRFEQAAAEHPEARFVAAEVKPERRSLGWHKRPAIFLFRKHSRITLLVEAVRVEPLHMISEADAQAEGIGEPYLGDGDPPFTEQAVMVSRWMQYRNLWQQINGDWADNPEVVAVTFRVVQQNIDEIKEAA